MGIIIMPIYKTVVINWKNPYHGFVVAMFSR